MAASTIVTDDDLLLVLNAIDSVRQQTLSLLSLQSTLQQKQSNSTSSSSSSSSTPTEQEIELSRQQSLLYSHLAQLRGLNRKAILSVRQTKQATADARHEIDTLHLQLQNLYYEQRHLRGEIAACEGYDHKYASLPLIPVEEFLAQHSEHAELKEHELMIARIEHEHAERQALEEKRQGLLKRKQGLIAENNRRKEDLANLDKDLEKFIEAAGPIITTFEKEY